MSGLSNGLGSVTIKEQKCDTPQKSRSYHNVLYFLTPITCSWTFLMDPICWMTLKDLNNDWFGVSPAALPVS